MSRLSVEQQAFIDDLAHEMSVQSTRSTAQPYALQVREEVLVAGIDIDVADEIGAYWDTSDTYYSPDSFDVFIQDLIAYGYMDAYMVCVSDEITTFGELKDSWSEPFVEFEGYKKERRAIQNIFLTEKAALAYIESNRYRLSNPDTYGICLSRNDQMEALYDIIKTLQTK